MVVLSPYPTVVIVITKYQTISTHSSNAWSVCHESGHSVTIKNEVNKNRATKKVKTVNDNELFERKTLIGKYLFKEWEEKIVFILSILELLYLLALKIHKRLSRLQINDTIKQKSL